jgi:hypothetical protein
MSKKADEAILHGPPRAGTGTFKAAAIEVETKRAEGLELSEILYKPLSFFKPNDENHVFDAAKEASPNYWQDLKRDIREAKAIINPVITLQDGTLLEGHSRIKIARELAAEGLDLGKIPVRLVASQITPEEVKRRVYLGNLSRFELDEDTRLALYAEIWPEFYKAPPSKGGRPSGNGAAVAQFRMTAEEVAKETGKSPRQTKYDRAVIVEAANLATAKGKLSPGPEEIRSAREKKAAPRRKPVQASAADPFTQLAIQLEKKISEINERANSAPTTAKGKKSREYLLGHVDGLTDALVSVNRLRHKAPKK